MERQQEVPSIEYIAEDGIFRKFDGRKYAPCGKISGNLALEIVNGTSRLVGIVEEGMVYELKKN